MGMVMVMHCDILTLSTLQKPYYYMYSLINVFCLPAYRQEEASISSVAVLNMTVLVQVLRHVQPTLAMEVVLGSCES